MEKSGLAHCRHHGKHWEFCNDYDERVAYIKAYKPDGEQPLRLKLFGIVSDDLVPGKDSPEWQTCVKAGQAYVKAGQAEVKAGQAYVKAGQAEVKARQTYVKAWQADEKARQAYVQRYQPELDALHAKLWPDCTWNGKTIFSKEGEDVHY